MFARGTLKKDHGLEAVLPLQHFSLQEVPGALSHCSQRSRSLYSALVKRTTRFKQKNQDKSRSGRRYRQALGSESLGFANKRSIPAKHKTQNTTDPPAEFSSAPRGCYSMDINCPCPKHLPAKLACGLAPAAKSKRAGIKGIKAGILSHLWTAK